jgi:DnaJ homolog subfamily C member 11
MESWVVGCGCSYNHGQHAIKVPIKLGFGSLDRVLVGMVLTPVVHILFDVSFISPLQKAWHWWERSKFVEQKKSVILEKAKAAREVIESMRVTAEEKAIAEQPNGLVIIEALYGDLNNPSLSDVDLPPVIDVLVPLQFMVEDHKLVHNDIRPKYFIPGFYDPCIGKPKSLWIKYLFRGEIHSVIVKDHEKIAIPKPS